ncbi:hypothetical protein HPP92_000102 [Vanilla planifolia]|uniref:Uncharacterized protein n=1 Tax=Vanilla planifolia TaxID=51239 RepID=A0A835RNI6_VANPL|nr:hypothetical protein HPP92_000102 [Vanilla planifolia]
MLPKPKNVDQLEEGLLDHPESRHVAGGWGERWITCIEFVQMTDFNLTRTPSSTRLPAAAHQPAAALRADVEVLDGEVGRGNPDGELQDLILSDDLDDVDPEQEHLDADAAQIAEAVGRYAAGDGGLVTELVRTRKGEAASSIEVGREFSRSVV